jgi:hypothetical protein
MEIFHQKRGAYVTGCVKWQEKGSLRGRHMCGKIQNINAELLVQINVY